jgi:hypothetical protein
MKNQLRTGADQPVHLHFSLATKRPADHPFPQPRQRRVGSYKGCFRESKPEEGLIIAG